jgi:hypothetical protein
MKPLIIPFEEFYLNDVREKSAVYDLFPELEKYVFGGVSGWMRVYVFRKGKHIPEKDLEESIDFLNQWEFEQKCIVTNENGTATLFENIEWGDWSEEFQEWTNDYFRYVLIIDKDVKEELRYGLDESEKFIQDLQGQEFDVENDVELQKIGENEWMSLDGMWSITPNGVYLNEGNNSTLLPDSFNLPDSVQAKYDEIRRK